MITLVADHQRPSAILFAYLCKTGGGVPDPGEFRLDDCANFASANSDNNLVDESGVMTSEFRVRAMFTSSLGEEVDCRTAGCEIAVAEEPFVDDPITIPLPLDPDAPLAPAPRIVAQPTSDLAGGDRVQIEGSDWFPGELVWIAQCRHTSPEDFGHCLNQSIDLVRANPNGEFDTSLVVADTGRSWYDGPIDCRDDACDVAAFRADTNATESATVPLSFADLPPAVPTGARPVAAEPHFTG